MPQKSQFHTIFSKCIWLLRGNITEKQQEKVNDEFPLLFQNHLFFCLGLSLPPEVRQLLSADTQIVHKMNQLVTT